MRCALLAGSVCALSHPPAQAEEPETLAISVSQALVYEGNLFRLPDDFPVPDDAARHDVLSRTEVGLAFDRTYSRQRLRAEVGVTEARYEANDHLDHTAPEAGLRWDWELGRRWNGVVAFDYDESLVDFDHLFLDTRRNIHRFRRAEAGANYRWHPSWQAGVTLSHVRSEYRDNAFPLSEFDTETADVGLEYLPRSGSRLRLGLRHTDGEFPNHPAEAGSLRHYTEREPKLSADWQLTGAVRLEGHVGYTRRTYDLAPDRDFSGVTGALAADWIATDKLAINVALRRRIDAEADVVATNAVTELVAVKPRWAVTEKFTMTAEGQVLRRDFRGGPAPGADPGTAAQDHTSYRYGMGLAYQPVRAVTLGASVLRHERDSDDPLHEFDGYTAQISAQVAF